MSSPQQQTMKKTVQHEGGSNTLPALYNRDEGSRELQHGEQ